MAKNLYIKVGIRGMGTREITTKNINVAFRYVRWLRHCGVHVAGMKVWCAPGQEACILYDKYRAEFPARPNARCTMPINDAEHAMSEFVRLFRTS